MCHPNACGGAITLNFASARIVVVAKAPVAGTVKTRLAPRLGAAGAARLHEDLVRRTLRTALEAAVGPVELCAAPSVDHPFFAACARDYAIEVSEQGEGDLGDRMARAIGRITEAGVRAVLIGADCPALDATYLRAAVRALDRHDVVLGPAEDGGYVLVGARRLVPEMFRGLQWGTETVLEDTRRRLRDANACWFELATLWDLDRPEDYDRWSKDRGKGDAA